MLLQPHWLGSTQKRLRSSSSCGAKQSEPQFFKGKSKIWAEQSVSAAPTSCLSGASPTHGTGSGQPKLGMNGKARMNGCPAMSLNRRAFIARAIGSRQKGVVFQVDGPNAPQLLAFGKRFGGNFRCYKRLEGSWGWPGVVAAERTIAPEAWSADQPNHSRTF
jgi:hypothetical protein